MLAHVRIVTDVNGIQRRVFVTWPGEEEEREVRVGQVNIGMGVHDVTRVTVEIRATVTVERLEAGELP